MNQLEPVQGPEYAGEVIGESVIIQDRRHEGRDGRTREQQVEDVVSELLILAAQE